MQNSMLLPWKKTDEFGLHVLVILSRSIVQTYKVQVFLFQEFYIH